MRTEQLHIRITKEEKKELKKKIKQSSYKNMSDYVINICLDNKIKIEDKEYKELLKTMNMLLSMLGNNFNQIAKKINLKNEMLGDDFILYVKENIDEFKEIMVRLSNKIIRKLDQ